MRNYFIVIMHFAIVLSAYAQDNCALMHDANWIWRASDTADLKRTTLQINFHAGNLEISLVEREMLIDAQNCPFSDEMGQLLFYSNGCYISNANDIPLLNSDSLNFGDFYHLFCTNRGYNGTQSMIALPVVGTDSLYYLLHKRERLEENPSLHLQCDNLFATLVDPFNGIALNKNMSIVSDTSLMYGHLTATRHANGKYWWILSPDMYTNSFYRILLDSSGFNVLSSQLIGDTTSPDHSGGQAKFSADGKRYMMYHSRFGVFLFDFNRTDGLLSNYRRFGVIDSTSIIGGCEFSPSGRFLYVNTMRDVYQYDLEAEDIPASEVHLGHYDGYLSPFATLFFHMERTPQEQIFLNCPNGVNILHVIEKPDKKGLDCDFKQHGIILPANIFWSMPHFPNYRLGALEGLPCDTTVSVTVDPLPGEIRVYPNPVRDVLHIETTIPMEAVHIYNLSGKRLAHWQNSSTFFVVSMSDFDPGMYIIEIILIDKSRLSAKAVVP